jgi:hypothetical protein
MVKHFTATKIQLPRIPLYRIEEHLTALSPTGSDIEVISCRSLQHCWRPSVLYCVVGEAQTLRVAEGLREIPDFLLKKVSYRSLARARYFRCSVISQTIPSAVASCALPPSLLALCSILRAHNATTLEALVPFAYLVSRSDERWVVAPLS